VKKRFWCRPAPGFSNGGVGLHPAFRQTRYKALQ